MGPACAWFNNLHNKDKNFGPDMQVSPIHFKLLKEENLYIAEKNGQKCLVPKCYREVPLHTYIHAQYGI